MYFLSMFKGLARGLPLLFCFGFLLIPTTFAQTGTDFAGKKIANYSASGLLSKASRLLGSEDYVEAALFLKEYAERMKDNEDQRVLTLVQEVRLKLGKINVYLEDHPSAISYFQSYLDNKPLHKWRQANKLLALSRYELCEFAACITAVTHGLAGPPVTETKQEKIDYSALGKEELGGKTARQLARYEKSAERDDGKIVSKKISATVTEEPDYTSEELIQMNLLLAESFSGLSQWEESLAPYKYVIENEMDEDRKGYAIMQLVTALIEQREFDEAAGFVMGLYRTEARYNIRVNLALMSAATALFDEEEYDSALPLYRMILPREKLFAHQSKKINKIRTDAGMMSVEIKMATNYTGRVQVMFGSAPATGRASAASAASLGKSAALLEEEDRLISLVGIPSYETEVMLRLGQLYAECDRPWEALTLAREVYSKGPDTEQGHRAFYEMIRVMVDLLEEYEQAEKLGLSYLEWKKDGVAPRQIAYLLTGMYQKQEEWAKVKALQPRIQAFDPENTPGVKQYEVELWYMQAVADLMLLNYETAEKGFHDVLENYPNSHQQDNTSYWYAMSQLFLQKYDEAAIKFEAYPVSFPDGKWLPEAAFRGGICMFATEKYTEAKARFTQVIHTWPDTSVYPDACSLRGDLLAADGLLDEALADYRRAIRGAAKVQQATYAVFQITAMFELEEKNDEIIDEVNAYLDGYGEEADIAKAMYWIGKTKLAQDRVDEAVDAYFKTIVDYGHDVRQEGVDLILSELVMVADRRLEEDELAALKVRIFDSIGSAESGTLSLRLRVLLAWLNGTELEIGCELIRETFDLKLAPPPVLSVICQASLDCEDYSRSKEMIRLFQSSYEDSEYMRDAYKLRAFDYESTGRKDLAMKVINDAQAFYGTASDLAWAQLMKGRILFERGDLNGAYDVFRAVFNIRDWRGEPCAEATYYLGRIVDARGDPRAAFGWYQRCYFQYKGHAGGIWSAKAYLASAQSLQRVGLRTESRDTYRAMLFDPYVNELSQAEQARKALGAEEVREIETAIQLGVYTNINVSLEMEVAE